MDWSVLARCCGGGTAAVAVFCGCDFVVIGGDDDFLCTIEEADEEDEDEPATFVTGLVVVVVLAVTVVVAVDVRRFSVATNCFGCCCWIINLPLATLLSPVVVDDCLAEVEAETRGDFGGCGVGVGDAAKEPPVTVSAPLPAASGDTGLGHNNSLLAGMESRLVFAEYIAAECWWSLGPRN